MTLLIPILAAIIIGILLFRLYLGNQAKKLSEDIAMSADISTEIDNTYHDPCNATFGKRTRS